MTDQAYVCRALHEGGLSISSPGSPRSFRLDSDTCVWQDGPRVGVKTYNHDSPALIAKVTAILEAVPASFLTSEKTREGDDSVYLWLLWPSPP